MADKRMIYTSKDKQLQSRKAERTGDLAYHHLELTGESFQTVEGFGGCFNELGYLALKKAGKEDQEQIMRNLFGKEECGFNYCRLPIGANDFAESWYSYNETEDDYAMEHFSIARDRKYLIPYLREAVKHSGDLTLFASPWSPPTWMKFPKAYNYGTIRWEEDVLKSYALYFKKYVEAYQREGITIDQIHVQNEPISDQKFPSCVWEGRKLKEFIRDYLGPEFDQHKTEIWLGTLNGPYDDYGDGNWQITQYHHYANEVLGDEQARQYIKGVGYQWGGKHALWQFHASYPDVKMIQTESECGDGRNSWEYAEYVFHLMWAYFQNGAAAYTYWNMILAEGGLSTWGWKQNSLVTISEDGAVTYQPEYYLMRHFSAFVKPGAVRMGLKGNFSGTALAFENPDQSLAVILLNPFDEAKEITFSYKGECYRIEADAHSFNTIML